MLSMESRLYVAERNAICSLAHYGRAVFVGHCASEALKGQGDVLRVFIRAEDGFKRNGAISEYGIEEKNAEAVCRRYNKKREKYYGFITSKKWNDMSNYDMILDSSRIGIEGCAGAIAALLGTESLSQHREITAWLYADDYKYFSSKDEAPLVKYLNDKFNCTVTFQQPPVGSEADSFNLMLGSNEYTDVMELTYSIDSPATLYEDGVIVDLAPYLETYMPNYYAWLNDPANEEERRTLYDDDGHCFVITAEAGDGTPSLVWGHGVPQGYRGYHDRRCARLSQRESGACDH